MHVHGLGSSLQPRTYLTDAGLACHDLAGYSHLTMELVRQMYRQHIRIVGKDPHPILLLANDILTVEFQVQLFASHPDLLSSIEALAIVGDSFMVKHLISMFLGYHAPTYPVKQFDSYDEAERWLAGYKKLAITL